MPRVHKPQPQRQFETLTHPFLRVKLLTTVSEMLLADAAAIRTQSRFMSQAVSNHEAYKSDYI